MEEQLVIKGSLEEAGLPELLHSICKNKESCVLTCRGDEFAKSIYIQDGQIIFASSNNLDDRLGESLIRYGKITVRDFLNATKLVRPDKRLGSLLIDHGAITPEELAEGVRTQVRDIIIGLFELAKGQYEMVLKETDTTEMNMLNVSTEDLIFDGVKSIQAWSRISHGIGTYTSKLRVAPDTEMLMLNLSLTPEEAHLYSLCSKGYFSVEEICGMSYLTNFETCRIVWALLILGAVEPLDTTERPPETVIAANAMEAELDLHDLVESYNDLCAVIYDFVFQRIGDEATELAGRAMIRAGETVPNITRNVSLDGYGRVDFDALLKNLSSVPENNRKDLVTDALEEVVRSLLNEVETRFGPADVKRVAEGLQKLRNP